VNLDHPATLPKSDSQEQRAIDRCRREIAAVESELRAGNPDVEGLCLALMDWSAELRLLEEARKRSHLSDSDSGERADLRPDRDVRGAAEPGVAG
jgi:hypothetical protein